MNNSSKSGLVGILSFLALTAASLGLLGVASHSASASSHAASVATTATAEMLQDVLLPEVVLAEPAPSYVVDYSAYQIKSGARRASPRADRKPTITASSTLCRVRGLEQGGRPGAETVLSCE